MSRALVYLLAVRLKNTALGILRRPGRLAGVLLLLGLFALTFVARSGGLGDAGTDAAFSRALLVAVLGLYLVLAVLGGLGEAGLGFLPADHDHVLAGPFRRHEVLVYHLARQYAQILLLGAMYVVFLGAASAGRPLLAWLGAVLCLAVAAHLQAAATLVAGQAGEHLFRRMRRGARTVLLVVLVAAGAVAFVGLAGVADVGTFLQRVLAHPVTGVVLAPALAAGRLAMAETPAQVLGPLLHLAAWVGGTFVLVLLLPFDVVETSTLGAARRRARDAEAAATSGRGGRAFAGAAALVWLGGVVLRRRLRVVVGLLAMLVVLLVASGAKSGGGGAVPGVLGALAFFPVIANVPFGFRGHREHLELLKTLPLSPGRMALAEIVVPAALVFGTQALAILAFAALGRLEGRWVAAALLALPVIDLGVLAVVETFQLGRDPRQAGFLWAALQMLAIVATLLPAGVAGAVAYDLGAPAAAAFGLGLLVHAAVVRVLLWVLARRFAAWEPGG